ncbi:Succinate--CoA ligase [GDP-forming] subunit beta, mitochondrial [Nymphon striatum]|nr:Succinate--CoA ligase [GDP-forming] subunit beta, mitochondrial [Nymphon striatum]
MTSSLKSQPTIVESAACASQSVRNLNLQEYQSKQLMADNGITVQQFKIAQTFDDASKIAKSLKVEEYVIKAQILAGGRGKGTFSNGMQGGVKLTKDAEEVAPLVEKMLGHKLKTKQTTGDGVMVKTVSTAVVMVAEALDIARETYLAILMDQSVNGPIIVASPAGGMDIEEVAEKTPELIYKVPIDIKEGLTDEQALDLAKNLKFFGPLEAEAAEQIKKLYKLFLEVDATQIEINPFGETPDGKVVCFDAKINFDDNAKFRQKEIFALDDMAESDPREQEAAKYDINYIGMDGNIACLDEKKFTFFTRVLMITVNGAGLAMATMDIIKLYGGTPANFLDVGGNVKEKQVFNAFKLLTSDPNVKAILVNIFGGIVNCATIARGISSAGKSIKLDVPLIVRLEGTNVDEAKQILADSKLPITSADDLDDAAKKAVSSLNMIK